jgi:hypothetical protein
MLGLSSSNPASKQLSLERRTNMMPGYTGHVQEGPQHEVPAGGYRETKSHIPGNSADTARQLNITARSSVCVSASRCCSAALLGKRAAHARQRRFVRSQRGRQY